MSTAEIDWGEVAREEAADAYEVWSGRRRGCGFHGDVLVLYSNGPHAPALRAERSAMREWLDARGKQARELAWAVHPPKSEPGERCGMAILVEIGRLGAKEIADAHAAIVTRLDAVRVS